MENYDICMHATTCCILQFCFFPIIRSQYKQIRGTVVGEKKTKKEKKREKRVGKTHSFITQPPAYLALLPDAVGAILSLKFMRWVPIDIVQHNPGSRVQVHPYTAGCGWKKKKTASFEGCYYSTTSQLLSNQAK